MVVDDGCVCWLVVSVGLCEDAHGGAVDFSEAFTEIPFPSSGCPAEFVFDDALCEACCAEVEAGCHAERVSAKFVDVRDEDMVWRIRAPH